jgi:hypothetical protein
MNLRVIGAVWVGVAAAAFVGSAPSKAWAQG